MREFEAVFIDRGSDETKSMYNRPGGVEDWIALTKASSYTPYEFSKTALQALLGSPDWSGLLDTALWGSIIDLGPGTGENALELLKSLEGHEALPIFLIDISEAMLRVAFETIARGEPEGLKCVPLIPIRCDFMRDLRLISSDLPKRKRIFCLLGGTLGNFIEKSFFEGLDSLVESGDMLLLGVEYHKLVQDGAAQSSDVFKEQYSSREHITFCINECRYIYGERADYQNFIDITLDTSGRKSSIKGTISLVTDLVMANRREIMKSHRYNEADFGLPQSLSFRLIERAPSPLSKFSQCLVFERL